MSKSFKTDNSEMDVEKVGFLAGGGEMGMQMRSYDWSKTAIGPVEAWPQSLRTTLSILLNSKFPMVLWWGEEFVQFYNDAYRRRLGNNGIHQAALGQRGVDSWPETWPIIRPLIDHVRSGGEARWNEDQPIPFFRNEKNEDSNWSFSFSPVYDESGNVGGVLVVGTQTTGKGDTLKKLAESKENLQSAIDIAELGTFKVDVASRIVSYSERVRIWLASDSLSEPLEVLYSNIHPDDLNRVRNSFAETLITEEQSRHDIHFRIISANDGSLRKLRSIGKTLFTKGSPHTIIGTIQDVTQRSFSHEKLKESENRFRNMLEQAPVAICLTRGRDIIVESINASMLKFMGKRKPEEAIGKSVVEIMPELKNQPILEIVLRVYNTRKPYKGNEVPVRLKQGNELKQFYFNISYTPYIEDGEVVGVIHVAIDVTEHVIARKKREEGEEELKRFKFMADQARDSFVLMREDGSFAYLNAKALETWGYTREEALNLRVPDVDPVYNHEAYTHLFAKAQKEAIPQFETLHKSKSGHIYPVEVNIVQVKIDQQHHLFAIARDISLRKQAEEALKAKNEQLIRINNDLDNFIYTASHDLKAPISNIEGLIQVLQLNLPADILESKRVKHIIHMMQESVIRFQKTIYSLTEVVKLQKENSALPKQVDLQQIIREVQLDLELVIKNSGAQIQVDLGECTTIRFSEKNLRSVVYNLLSNSIKYSSPDRVPHVLISCHSTPDYQVLSVKDNGLGIDISRTSQLFTMFKRFHSHVEGTGIGLYMIKKMIDNEGGKIEVESELGEGTTFHVYFKR